MAEFKPGKWRFESGQEVVVIQVHQFITWIDSIGSVTREDRILFSARKPYYLGPAVIGDPGPDIVGAWVQRCNELERQCKERDEYRRKWIEAVEEVRRLQKEVDDAEALLEKSREQVSRNSLAFETLRIEHAKLTRNVKYSLDTDGIQWFQFDSVTVAVREGKEAIAQKASSGMWWAILGKSVSVNYSTRKEAEAWCRKQIVPVEEWRPATVEDVGKPCRVREDERSEHTPYDKLVAVIDHEWRYIVADFGCEPVPWKLCEVRK